MIEAALRDLEARFGVTAAAGLQISSPESLARRPFDPGWALMIVSEGGSATTNDRGPAGPLADPQARADEAAPFDPPVLPGRHARPAGAAAVLAALYPADHPVHGLLGAADVTVGDLTAPGLVESSPAWYLPPLVGEANLASPHGLPWLAARLRAPDGCPWDREQTHLTLRKHLLEETYEVYDALEAGPTPALAEELGDLLLQIVLHAEHAAEAGIFDLTDVYRSIMAKIVRRHPHVFGEVEARTVGDVLRNWETIKAGERADRDRCGRRRAVAARTAQTRAGMPAAFAGVSRSLPALAYAQEIQERAASLGYDWPDVEGVIDKLEEEALELLAADERGSPARGVRRPAAGHRQPRAQAGPRCRGGPSVGQRQVRRPVRARRAPGRRPPAEHHDLRRIGRPLGSCQARGSRRTGEQLMTIGSARFREDGRTPAQLRPATIETDVQNWAEGSCLIKVGGTHVLCSATLEDRIPPHLRGKGTGWVTAEYAMLPRATSERTQRESVKGRLGGRTHEIQRLVGRSLRGVVDTARLGERTVTVDCDVLHADGGTRTASITGGYVALVLALRTRGLERPSSVGWRRSASASSTAPRTSTSTTRRTRAPTSTSTSSAPTPAPTSSCRARPRASPSIERPWIASWSWPTMACASSSSSRPRRSLAQLPRRRSPVRRVLVATRSPHKLAELRQLLDLPGVELVSLDDLGIPGDPIEDGATFADNAIIKARWGVERAGLPTLADDSGIEVEALGGGPGVRTRRYAGEHASDDENNAKLLAELAALGALSPEARRARYVCVLACLRPDRPDEPLLGRGHLRRPHRDRAAGQRRLRLRPHLRARLRATGRPDGGADDAGREERGLASGAGGDGPAATTRRARMAGTGSRDTALTDASVRAALARARLRDRGPRLATGWDTDPTMDACGCDEFASIFDRRNADDDLRRYRRDGPDRTTRMLLDLIRAQGVDGATVLDIGGGIGVIDQELLRAGASRATLADASAASVAVAREAADAAGLADRMTFVQGDAVRRADDIGPADVVTLDRVICCYRDVEVAGAAVGGLGRSLVRHRPAARPLDRAAGDRARVCLVPADAAAIPAVRPPEPRRRCAGGRRRPGAAGRGRHVLLARRPLPTPGRRPMTGRGAR